MTLVQQVENVVDLARRITLVVRTVKNVLNISIVNRFLAFPQKNISDRLLVVSVQQIVFYCLSGSMPHLNSFSLSIVSTATIQFMK